MMFSTKLLSFARLKRSNGIFLKVQNISNCSSSVYENKELQAKKFSQLSSAPAFKDTELTENSFKEEKIYSDITAKINSQIKEKSHSRLFAVIQFCEHQFKITDEDIISVGSFFPAKVGDKIILEKVLAVGSTDFTILGRPLLSKDLVGVEATVIEKTYIVPRPLYRHFKNFRRLHWFRTPYVLIRINSIYFKNLVDDLPAVEGIQDRVIY